MQMYVINSSAESVEGIFSWLRSNSIFKRIAKNSQHPDERNITNAFEN